jgi:hypothetical protein
MEEIREVNTYQSCGSALVSQRIRIQLFYLSADPDPVSQTYEDPSPDPDPSQTLPSVKVSNTNKILYVGTTKRSQNIPMYT